MQKNKSQNVVAVPADGQFDLEELIPYKNFKDNQVIAFYRDRKTSYSFFRNSLSFLNRAINSIFLRLKLHDVNWVKVYKLKSLTALP